MARSDRASRGNVDRLLASRAPLARAAALASLAGPLIWLPQAAVIASAISALVGGGGLSLPVAAGLFAGLAILRAGADALALSLSQRLSREVQLDLRRELIGVELRRAPMGEAEDPGGLAHLMGEGIDQIGPWTERFRPAMVRARVLPLVILALVLWQSWALALALLLTGPLIPLFMALVGWAAEAASKAQLVENGALNRMLIDRVAALLDLRLLGATARAASDLAARSDSLRMRTMKVLRLAFLSSTVLEFFASLGVALVAVQVGLSLLGLIHWGGWGGGIGVFGGIFVLLIAPDFYQPLRDLSAAWHDRAAAEAGAAAIVARMAPGTTILGKGAPAPAASGALAWRGLRLAAGPGGIAVPDGALQPGEAVALTGASGAGKSTLLATLAGLQPALAGEIRLGDLPLSADSADRIRAGLALVPQSPRFPATTLRHYLSATGADPVQALQAARADRVVASLPHGLNTRLGETGGGVSGGEARRLMIARALIDPPQVLFADEPTADLDPETAGLVTDALLALRGRGIALVVATHDPALIARLDRRIDLGGEA